MADRLLGSHPSGDKGTQYDTDPTQHNSADQGQQKSLVGKPVASAGVICPVGTGNKRQHRSAKRISNASHQPSDRSRDADRGSRLLPQTAYHSGIHILKKGRQYLLQQGGDREHDHLAQQVTISQLCCRLCHIVICLLPFSEIIPEAPSYRVPAPAIIHEGLAERNESRDCFRQNQWKEPLSVHNPESGSHYL